MIYAACPKCAHPSLPADQAFPAACPACGLILAKFRAAALPVAGAPSAATASEKSEGTATATPADGFMGRLLSVPDEVSKVNWAARLAALALFSLWTLWIWRDVDIPAGESGSTFLHSALIPFHEAGHYAIFRWFGPFIMTLGGTLGQHLLPLVLGGVLLLRQRNPFGAALALWLLGCSVIDMGVYMYDAYDPKLGLLDGRTGADSDGHDWQNIFGDLGLIRSARGIGRFSGWVGYFMMGTALAWAALVLWRQKANLSDSPFAEEEAR